MRNIKDLLLQNIPAPGGAKYFKAQAVLKRLYIITIVFMISSCGRYFTSYDYYRFDNNNNTMLITGSDDEHSTRKNILFKNEDLQVIGVIQETRNPPFTISINFDLFKDSLLIDDFQVYLITDSVISPTKTFVNLNSNNVIYFNYFSELSKEIRFQTKKTFYFGYQTTPNREEIKLRLLLEYHVQYQIKSKTIQVDELKRRKTKKQFVGLH